jgi:hypothetical protein
LGTAAETKLVEHSAAVWYAAAAEVVDIEPPSDIGRVAVAATNLGDRVISTRQHAGQSTGPGGTLTETEGYEVLWAGYVSVYAEEAKDDDVLSPLRFASGPVGPEESRKVRAAAVGLHVSAEPLSIMTGVLCKPAACENVNTQSEKVVHDLDEVAKGSRRPGGPARACAG